MNEFELYHHGVKGMKWGVRNKRYYNSDGSLNDRGVKKYAKKGYAKDILNANEIPGGKLLDRYTGAHRTSAAARYDTSSDKANRKKAEQYVRNKKTERTKAAKTAAKGAKAAAKTLSKVGKMYVTDQLFLGGAGTAATKAAIKTVGRASITAYTMARGGYDIKWYDKHGRRVG